MYEKNEWIRYPFHLENQPKQTTCKELIHKEEADVVFPVGIDWLPWKWTTGSQQDVGFCFMHLNSHRMEKKMPFFPLCHFVFIVSCVGVMTPFSRKNTSRLFPLWSSAALEFGFWKLQMKKVRIRADLIEKELFSLSSLSSMNLFFPFSLKHAHKHKTT